MNPVLVMAFLFMNSLLQQCKHKKNFSSKSIAATGGWNGSSKGQHCSWKQLLQFLATLLKFAHGKW